MSFPRSVRPARAAALSAAVLAALALTAPAHAAPVAVTASVETAPVSHSGDAADDPAIWVHPTDPAKSVVVGTDKKGALEVYDLTGARIQRISGDYGNNVDVRGNVVVSADDEAAGGDGALHVYRIDPATRKLTHLKDVPTEVTAHGICLYTSRASGKLYAFPNSTSGRVEQWELAVSGNTVTATSVRLWDAGSAVEGCYADDSTGKLYLGEEDVGVWVYGPSPPPGPAAPASTRRPAPAAASRPTSRASPRPETASSSPSQGSNDYTVYDRTSQAYLGRFAVTNGDRADDCEDTDGIDATSAALGPAFPQGVFVCQDGSNGTPGTSGNQNFKFVPLERVTVGAR